MKAGLPDHYQTGSRSSEGRHCACARHARRIWTKWPSRWCMRSHTTSVSATTGCTSSDGTEHPHGTTRPQNAQARSYMLGPPQRQRLPESGERAPGAPIGVVVDPVSYTHLRAHETDSYLVCRLLLE